MNTQLMIMSNDTFNFDSKYLYKDSDLLDITNVFLFILFNLNSFMALHMSEKKHILVQ
jgi:hypothetical protein